MVKKYSFEEILDAAEISFSQYMKVDDEGKATKESWEKAFAYIPRICANRPRFEDKPFLKDFFYIRGILNNRLEYVNQRLAIEVMEDAYAGGVPVEELSRIAKSCRSWSGFRREVEDLADTTAEDLGN